MKLKMEQKRIEAAIKGVKQYEGRQCNSCGNTKRYVLNNGCVNCLKASTYKYMNKIRDAIRAAQKNEAN